jgi:hypothetical protein
MYDTRAGMLKNYVIYVCMYIHTFSKKQDVKSTYISLRCSNILTVLFKSEQLKDWDLTCNVLGLQIGPGWAADSCYQCCSVGLRPSACGRIAFAARSLSPSPSLVHAFCGKRECCYCLWPLALLPPHVPFMLRSTQQ